MEIIKDGIYQMVDKKDMVPEALKIRNFYDMVPDAPIIQRPFGFLCYEAWAEAGHMTLDEDATVEGSRLFNLFGFDKSGKYILQGLGWCEAGLCPIFDEQIVEDRGKYEVVIDPAGRHVLLFKGRKHGFMPEYLDHPVKDRKTWEEQIKWRMDPKTPERYVDFDKQMQEGKIAAAQGKAIAQHLVGGYMYLRSLMGPEDLLYQFYDNPDLIHECMQTWLELADGVIAKYQQHLTIDEVFIAEDICYNCASLISHDMIREFLFPYYQQLLTNIKRRNLDKNRPFYFQVDTDGKAETVIDVYKEIGMNYMSPFEVASGSDVVAIAKKYPDLLMGGGIDKRILAQGPEAIDRHLDYIMPYMKKRGGYIPTCDHMVPAEVSFENYMHYRKRMLEYAK